MRIRLSWLALLALALCAGAVGARAEAPACEPFEAPEQAAALAASPRDEQGRSEALLVLAKDTQGSIRADELDLADGVRIAESRFSPVLCATVARLVGPPGTSAAELVAKVPPTGAVVPNTRYVTAGVTTRALPALPAATGRPDPYRSLQYALDAIGVDEARSVSQGGGARVAVLDSAPEAGHPDLTGVRVVAPGGGAAPPAAAHGTLVVGIIAAVAGNGFGIAGVAPAAQLTAIPVCRPPAQPSAAPGGDVCELYDLIAGLDTAWEQETQVLNLSLVGDDNPALERGMSRLAGLGVLLVAAAGNEASEEPRYPAAYPTVIGVGAVDRAGALYEQGNRGPSAEILAPGVEIVSTMPGGGFAFSDGTSLAAAHVSGVLALLIGAGSEPLAARSALFERGHASRAARPRTAALPRVCEVLGPLGRPCGAP